MLLKTIIILFNISLFPFLFLFLFLFLLSATAVTIAPEQLPAVAFLLHLEHNYTELYGSTSVLQPVGLLQWLQNIEVRSWVALGRDAVEPLNYVMHNCIAQSASLNWGELHYNYFLHSALHNVYHCTVHCRECIIEVGGIALQLLPNPDNWRWMRTGNWYFIQTSSNTLLHRLEDAIQAQKYFIHSF